jgi:protein gp37
MLSMPQEANVEAEKVVMTSIAWTSEVWNFLLGCSRDNEECDRCYAMRVAHRGMDPSHRGLTKIRPKGSAHAGVDWNGEVRFLPERLGIPLHWRKARKVFVNSMSDLFHPRVPFEVIAASLLVMAACPHHTFQVLTKRAARAREFFAWLSEQSDTVWNTLHACAERHILPEDFKQLEDRLEFPTWPLPNLHLGVSAGRQETAEAKVFDLLHCPAAVHWVSMEPMLGPVDLTRLDLGDGRILDALRGEIHVPPTRGIFFTPNKLAWVVPGGESGAGARACDLAWLRGVLAQGRRAGTAMFVKQLGAKPIFFPGDDVTGYEEIAQRWPISDAKGETMAEWPEDLRVRQWPAA